MFAISLYELNREIKDRIETEEAKDIRKVVSLAYYNFLDVFSKKASNKLPISRAYNHVIELEELSSKSKLGYAPL